MIQKIANKIVHITAKWRFPVIRNYHEDKIIGFTFDNILSGDIILTYKKGEFSNIYTNLFGDFWKHASIVINKHTAVEAVAPRVKYKRIDSLFYNQITFVCYVLKT